MPCTTSTPSEHRVKNPTVKSCFNAMVTRPVTRKKMLSNPKAMEAFMKEWKGLWDQEVFDFSSTRALTMLWPRQSSKVRRSIWPAYMDSSTKRTINLKKMIRRGSLKGEVLLGDQVKDHNMEATLFQDLGNSPATFDASRWADYYGCVSGNDVQMADAIQAYIQANLSGVPCGVELPDEAWHPSANRHKFPRPVCRLVKAIYGHPDAGTMWEQHCHTARTEGRIQTSW